MPQQLSTELQLDALLSSGFEDAFKDAGDLMSDLKKESADLRKQLKKIGKEADEIEKIGKESNHLRKEMSLLERQIKETSRATERFGESRSHFRKASIGARALRSDIGGIVTSARNAVFAIGAIGAAAGLALVPDQELLAFDQTIAGTAQISPEVDAAGIEMAKSQIRELSNQYGVSAAEIAQQHQQLTRNLGFEGAQETISASVAFQTATGLSVTDFEEELATARISLGIDTPAETREFLELLQQAHQQGIKIDNLDLGDMETLLKRTGEDVFGDTFQREFLTTIAFRQVDSFQFADYSAAFQEDFARSIVITPKMETKDIEKAQENIRLLERHALRAEDGILGAMRVFQQLTAEQQAAFREQLAPVLGEQTIEVIARGSEALPRISEQVDKILASERSLQDAALGVATTWSGVWGRIGVTGQNALGILRERFAEVFGPPILGLATRFFDFLNAHSDEIKNFFTDIRDGISPVISKIWATIKMAYPDIRDFAFEVWGELQRQWQAIAPAAKVVGDVILGIAKAVGSFLKEHPRLVATVLAGVVAWNAYKIAAGGVSVVNDLVRGSIKHVQGHMHLLNAKILENARVQGTVQTASLSISKVFSGIGAAAFGALPGIGAMGTGIWAAVAPALPIILPVVAAIGALAAAGYIVYRNWEPIKAFFVDNFETIRNVLMFVFPPLGLLVGFAGVIKDNWAGIKEFFSTLWETVRLAAQFAMEGIQFIALSALVGIQNAWASIPGFFGDLWSGVHEFFISSPLAPVFEWMADGVKAVASPLLGFFGDLWSGIHGFFLDTPLAPIFEWMVDGVKAVVSPLVNFFSDFWQNVSDMAGRALGWITDLLDTVNEFLGRHTEELREANVDLREQVEVAYNIEVPAMPDVRVAEIETPTIESPEMPGVPSVSEVESMIQTEAPSLAAQTAPIIAPADTINNLATKTQPVSMNRELVDVGLGILLESRKQTLLLKNLPTEVGEAGVATVPILAQSEIPALETPTIQVAEMPVIELPEVVVVAPRIDAPTIETPMVQMAEIPALDMPTIETPDVEIESPSVEVISDMPQMDVLPIETPLIDSPSVAIETPMVQMAEIPALDMPTIETPDVEIESPSVEVISDMPQMGVLPIETPLIDSPSVAIETPMVQMAEIPALDMPMVQVDSPVIEIEDLATPAPSEMTVQQTQEAAESDAQPAPVTVNNSFTIVQREGEDPEALARRVVEIIDQSRSTFLAQ